MNFVNELDDNTLLIIPNTIKNKVLRELNNKTINFKIMSLNDIKNNLLYSYDTRAILFIMNKYNVKYEIAINYLENTYYIDDINYDDNKLKYLQKIKKELQENNLLIKNDLFRLYLESKNIVVYGYDNLTKFDQFLFDKLRMMTSLKSINNKTNNNNPKLYEFETIEEEIEFVSQEIVSLINKGVSINNIKLANITKEYYNPLKRIFGFYNIPLELENTDVLYGTNIVMKFLELLKDNNLEEALETIKKTYEMSQDNIGIYNQIIDISNKYNIVNIEALIYEFKHCNKVINKLKNKVSIASLDSVDNEDHVYLMNFNNESIPKIYKDEDYLSDTLKEKINIDTSLELNKIKKEKTLNQIKTINNLVITYKLKTSFQTYYPSCLIESLNIETIRNKSLNNNYSNLLNQIHLSEYEDDFFKYGIINDKLPLLYHNYSNDYKSYNNQFSGIDENKLRRFLNNNISLSYSGMDNYYRCSFRYYLDNILKLNIKEDSFLLFIGNLFHFVLSKAFLKEFNFEEEFSFYCTKRDLDPKEIIFLEKLKEELVYAINTINEQKTHCSFNKALYEERIVINKDKDIKISFNGVIDKLLYKETDTDTLVVIIDYKTGNTKINLSNAIYGIGLQLPVYLYLVKNTNKLKNIKVVGFYLQNILHNEISKKLVQNYEQEKKDNLKLVGYSINKEKIISEFDDSYVDSEVIKSMKVGSNGFYAYTKLISEEEIEELVSLVDNKIEEASNEIKKAHFTINPKVINNQNIGCENCNYKEICYKKEEDKVYLEKVGEEDATVD